MAESQFTGLLIGLGVVLIVFAALGVFLLRQVIHSAVQAPRQPIQDPVLQRQQLLLDKAKAACPGKACCKCKNWDLDAGQAAVGANRTFLMAARELSPNQMGRNVNEEHKPSLPVVFDKWELFGVCALESACRHAIDSCNEFQKV